MKEVIVKSFVFILYNVFYSLIFSEIILCCIYGVNAMTNFLYLSIPLLTVFSIVNLLLVWLVEFFNKISHVEVAIISNPIYTLIYSIIFVQGYTFWLINMLSPPQNAYIDFTTITLFMILLPPITIELYIYLRHCLCKRKNS